MFQVRVSQDFFTVSEDMMSHSEDLMTHHKKGKIFSSAGFVSDRQSPGRARHTGREGII